MKLLRWNSVRPQGPQGKRAKPSASDSADRGWKSRKVSPLPVEGEIFSLTFPFIDQALNEAALRQKNRKSFRSINWVITLRRRYDDPTSTAHAGRAPAAKLLRWNHSIVPPARRRIRPTFSSLARSTRSRGYSSVPTVPDSGKKAGVVKLQPDRLCAALLLCQDFEACVPAVGHSFLTAAATASSDPQSGGGGTNTHRASASQKSCPVDDHLRGGLAALRGGSLASQRHRLGAHDHYGSSR